MLITLSNVVLQSETGNSAQHSEPQPATAHGKARCSPGVSSAVHRVPCGVQAGEMRRCARISDPEP